MEIRKDIFKTVAWFDLFDRPLLDAEVHRYLFKEAVEIKLVRRYLRKMVGQELSRKGNLYCLKGREKLFDTYKKRQMISKKKWRKAKFTGMMLRKMPFVRGVAVSQNLAIDNAKESSDIDLFIITAKNKLWTTRLFVNLALDIFGFRSLKNKTPICPNFLVASDSLDLRDVAIKEDLYLAYWISSLKVLFGKDIFEIFYGNNEWAKKYFLNIDNVEKNRIKLNGLLWVAQKILEVLFWPVSLFEEKLMKFQIKRIEMIAEKEKNPILKLTKSMAKIHYNDKRTQYLREWQKKIKSYS